MNPFIFIVIAICFILFIIVLAENAQERSDNKKRERKKREDVTQKYRSLVKELQESELANDIVTAINNNISDIILIRINAYSIRIVNNQKTTVYDYKLDKDTRGFFSDEIKIIGNICYLALPYEYYERKEERYDGVLISISICKIVCKEPSPPLKRPY